MSQPTTEGVSASPAPAPTPIRSLYSDTNRYLQSFAAFLRDSDEHDAIINWIKTYMTELIGHFGGKKEIRLLSVGCGDGQVDLVVLETLRDAFERIHVTLIDSSSEQIDRCRVQLQSMEKEESGKAHVTLDFLTESFEGYIRRFEDSGPACLPKYDSVYLVQMLYYVKDPLTVLNDAVKSLEHSGRMFLIHVSGNSGCAKVWKKFGPRLPQDDNCNYTTANDIYDLCQQVRVGDEEDKVKVKVEKTEIESTFKIGAAHADLETSLLGQLAVDFIVEASHFVEKAEEPLKSEVLHFIASPQCSSKNEKGELCFNNNLSAITLFKST